MTDRGLREVKLDPHPTPITSHKDAERLDDAPFVAYALIQGFKLFSAIVCKRWPHLK